MASPLSCDSSPELHHFVKIILSDDTDSLAKLMIPRKFVMKYGDKMHTRMYLKAPNGLVWAVDLQRHKDDVWLHNGWLEFAKFYSIQFGYILVFEYRSGSDDFNVLIFDSSSTEIDYPTTSTSLQLNVVESIATQTRKRVNDEDDDLTSSDIIRSSKKNMAKITCKEATDNGVSLMPNSQRKKCGKEVKDCASATEKGKTRAIVAAGTFKSDNPFFVVHIKPSHVARRCYGMVTLQVEGKTWLVNCDMKWDWCRLSIGWDRFARENSLNVDDVCVFEVVDASKKLLKAFIFRASEETNCEGNKRIPMVKSETEVARVLESVDAFKSKNPFFKVTIHSSYVHNGSINVPLSFIKRYITKKQPCDVILQVSQGRTWLVKCCVYKINARLCVGWKTFVQENKLAAGDVCIFELVNSAQKLLNVVTFRTKS